MARASKALFSPAATSAATFASCVGLRASIGPAGEAADCEYVRHARAHLLVDPDFRRRLMLSIRAIVFDAGKEEVTILHGEYRRNGVRF
jgi:hypothetical protein